MIIRIDIHRHSRIWKIGNNQGVFYGQFKEEDIKTIFGKDILAVDVDKKTTIITALKKVIDPRFYDQIPEIAIAIKNRITKIYPQIKTKIEELK